jgi:preprotein translocase subunit SecG
MESFTGILPYIQMVLAVLLVVGVLMQQSDASLGAVFGGGNDAGGIKRTRRGLEKILFNGSITVSILFVLSSLIALLL